VHNRSRVVAVLGATALLFTTTSAVSQAAASHDVTGGNTTIMLKAATLTAVDAAGVTLHRISPATIRNGDLRLPVRGGTVNPPSYHVHQAGGFEFVKGATTIKFTHIVIDSKTARATAHVTGQGTIVALVFGQPQSGTGGPTKFGLGGFSVKFSAAAIRALDTAFGTSVFSHHPKLGTGSTVVRWNA
jgi:hypothetical protein